MNKLKYDITDIAENTLRGEASVEEIILLSNWIITDRHLNEWVVEEIASQPPVAKGADLDHICQNIVKGNHGKKISLKYFLLTIAALFAGFGIFLVLNIEHHEPEHSLSVRTVGGEKSRIALPDGSSVILNSKTFISYFYDKKSGVRNVKLNGEAWFDVKTDARHPFVVDCDNLKVECRGTEFNVTAYQDDETVTVVLKDGKVNAVSARENIEMRPGMLLNYDRTSGHVDTDMVTASDYCDWRNGEIHCDNITLEALFKRLSRTYGTAINIQTPSLRAERVYGMMLEGDLDHVLDIVCEACEMEYRKEKDNTVYVFKTHTE